jgi:transposase
LSKGHDRTGIGPIISSAMVAAIGSGAAFAKGWDFSAWIGLVPKQISTGTAERGMRGLSKTHGFATPTGLNVDLWDKRQRAVRVCEIALKAT